MLNRLLNKELSGKSFVNKFIILTASICALMLLLMYFIDPWLYYRIDKSNKYMLDSVYVSAGLIKNKQYDAAVIGSSYFQEFRMKWFRDKLGYEPINLTIPGLDAKETPLIVDRVLSQGEAEHMVICLSYYTFADNTSKSRLPKYLLDNKSYNDVQYLLSYEAWMKFFPLDMATLFMNRISPKLLKNYSSMMDMDSLGNELNRYKFSKKAVMNSYLKSNTKKTNITDEGQQLLTMKENFDHYLDQMQIADHNKVEYIFVLPPHSALYWYSLQREGKYEIYQEFETYVLKSMAAYSNVRIVNAQTIPEITDLNHYRDTTHFDLGIQELLVDMIASNKNDLNLMNVTEKQNKLGNLVKLFASQNSDWLKSYKT